MHVLILCLLLLSTCYGQVAYSCLAAPLTYSITVNTVVAGNTICPDANFTNGSPGVRIEFEFREQSAAFASCLGDLRCAFGDRFQVVKVRVIGYYTHYFTDGTSFSTCGNVSFNMLSSWADLSTEVTAKFQQVQLGLDPYEIIFPTNCTSEMADPTRYDFCQDIYGFAELFEGLFYISFMNATDTISTFAPPYDVTTWMMVTPLGPSLHTTVYASPVPYTQTGGAQFWGRRTLLCGNDYPGFDVQPATHPPTTAPITTIPIPTAPPPILDQGACCFVGNVSLPGAPGCFFLNHSECTNLGSPYTYLGNQTACSQSPGGCRGGCCCANGQCQPFVTYSQCTTQCAGSTGLWIGGSSISCNNVTCSGPIQPTSPPPPAPVLGSCEYNTATSCTQWATPGAFPTAPYPGLLPCYDTVEGNCSAALGYEWTAGQTCAAVECFCCALPDSCSLTAMPYDDCYDEMLVNGGTIVPSSFGDCANAGVCNSCGSLTPAPTPAPTPSPPSALGTCIRSTSCGSSNDPTNCRDGITQSSCESLPGYVWTNSFVGGCNFLAGSCCCSGFCTPAGFSTTASQCLTSCGTNGVFYGNSFSIPFDACSGGDAGCPICPGLPGVCVQTSCAAIDVIINQFDTVICQTNKLPSDCINPMVFKQNSSCSDATPGNCCCSGQGTGGHTFCGSVPSAADCAHECAIFDTGLWSQDTLNVCNTPACLPAHPCPCVTNTTCCPALFSSCLQYPPAPPPAKRLPPVPQLDNAPWWKKWL